MQDSILDSGTTVHPCSPPKKRFLPLNFGGALTLVIRASIL